jgi:hypothetical protein
VITGIHRLGNPEQHGRDRLTVDGHAQIFGPIGAFDLDGQLADVRLDLLAFVFCR